MIKNISNKYYNKATRIVASLLGVFGGLMGMEHGVLETLQGNVSTGGMIIDAVGRQTNSPFQGSEPALTILPNFLIAGVITIILGLLAVIWAATFIHKKNGVPVLFLLSTILFLVGGGLAPLIILILTCSIATRIHKPLRWWRAHLSSKVQLFFERLWPWIYIIFFIPSLINLQTAIFGNFFGVKNSGLLQTLPLFIVVFLILSIISGFSYDIKRQPD